MIVTTEVNASVRLLTASALMDTELAAVPINSLKVDKKTFPQIPAILVLIIPLFLSIFSVGSGFYNMLKLMNYLFSFFFRSYLSRVNFAIYLHIRKILQKKPRHSYGNVSAFVYCLFFQFQAISECLAYALGYFVHGVRYH